MVREWLSVQHCVYRHKITRCTSVRTRIGWQQLDWFHDPSASKDLHCTLLTAPK